MDLPATARPRVFFDTVGGYLRGLSPRSRRFWLLVPVTGVLAGLSAVGTVHLLHFVQSLAWRRDSGFFESVHAASPWRRLLVPLAGGALVVLVGLVSREPSGGHGTSRIIEAIWVRRGRVPVGWAIVRGLLTLVVVALGASLGREGALIYFGAALASWLGRRAHLDPDQLKVLVACGGTAGLAAAYNTPIGGALFGLEVFLGGLALELYGPLIFSSVAATLVSRALLFDHPSYVIPHYKLHHPSELLLYLLLGALVGLLSGLFVRLVEASNRFAAAAPPWLRRLEPLSAMLLVGAVGIFYPQVFGNGYDTVNQALVGNLPFTLLLTLPFLKLVLSSLCSAAGVPGGMFTPTLFIGGLAGGAFGLAAQHVFPSLVPSTGGYILVGMGAALAGSTHATLAAAILLFELTGSYDVILPLLAACVVAASASRTLTPESIFTAPLRRRGVELPGLARPAWMQHEGVRALVRDDAVCVLPEATLEKVLLAAIKLRESEQLYVVDAAGRVRGAIALDTVSQVLAEQPALELLVAADLMQAAPAVSVDASLWEVTRRALAAESARLPVVSPREGGRFVGTLVIRDVLAIAAGK